MSVSNAKRISASLFLSRYTSRWRDYQLKDRTEIRCRSGAAEGGDHGHPAPRIILNAGEREQLRRSIRPGAAFAVEDRCARGVPARSACVRAGPRGWDRLRRSLDRAARNLRLEGRSGPIWQSTLLVRDPRIDELALEDAAEQVGGAVEHVRVYLPPVHPGAKLARSAQGL